MKTPEEKYCAEYLNMTVAEYKRNKRAQLATIRAAIKRFEKMSAALPKYPKDAIQYLNAISKCMQEAMSVRRWGR